MNVVLVGEGSAGAQVFRALHEKGTRVIGVLTTPPGKESATGGLWKTVLQTGLDPWPAELVKDARLADQLRAAGANLLINVYSLYVICEEVLTAPTLGSFNLHPGPLPKYAGLNSMLWAIYRGETRHGVTVHKMVPRVDAGPIAFQDFFDIADDDTGLSVATKCIEVAVSLALKLLDAAQSPLGIPLAPQDLSQREYLGKGPPRAGLISWDSPARGVFNLVRACDFAPFRSPWGSPRTFVEGREMSITKASLTGIPCHSPPGTVGRLGQDGAEVACRDEWLLVRRVQLEGRFCAPAKALRAGTCFASSV